MTSFADFWQRAFRGLLWRLRPEHLQAAIAAFGAKADQLAAEGADFDTAAADVYRGCRQQVIDTLLLARFGPPNDSWSRTRRQRREQLAELLERSIPTDPAADGPDFHCDAGLGGLARWLRAGGYDARYWPGVADDALLCEAIGSNAIMLTTDSRLMLRGTIDQGIVAALLVPNTIDKRSQFRFVAQTLELPLRAARCMACGGRLVPIEKDSVRDRIPPRTYPWRDEYFLCDRCQKLYWEGTHWERIRGSLENVEC